MKRMVTMSVLIVVLMAMFANVGFAAEMKKVVILYSETFKFFVEPTLKGLEQAGFVDQKSVTVVQVEVSGSDSDVAQLTTQIQAAAPDVVVNYTNEKDVLAALTELSIPIILRSGVESYVDADGFPTANIVGMYSTPPDLVYNSYKFFQKVAPLKAGQQAIFLDNSNAAIPKEVAIDALQRLQIPLKAVVDATVYEDFQQAILQYNDDPDVGWVLRFATPRNKQDGSSVNLTTELYPWLQEHLKKPTIYYYENAVQWGTLCGFSIDANAVNVEIGKLTARILQGEDIRTIKAEYPQKISIALNRKTATNLGIVFPMDVLSLANVIYDDYEGKQVIRKK